MTVSESFSSHGPWPLSPEGRWFSCWSPLSSRMVGQFGLSSYPLERNCGPYQEWYPVLFWWLCSHLTWWLMSICSCWESFQSPCLAGLQEVCTYLPNFLWADVTAASMSEHMRQSPVADTRSESAVCACESLLNTLVDFILTDTHGGVSIMIPCGPWGLYNHPIIRVSVTLDYTGGEINELGLRLVGAVASSRLNSIVRFRLDRWKDALMADVSFFALGVTLLPPCSWGALFGGTVMLFVFRTNGKHKHWESDQSVRDLDVWHRENRKQQSANSMCLAAH